MEKARDHGGALRADNARVTGEVKLARQWIGNFDADVEQVGATATLLRYEIELADGRQVTSVI